MARNGKGSAPRITADYDNYRSSWDRIFGESSDDTFDNSDGKTSSRGRTSPEEKDSDEEQASS